MFSKFINKRIILSNLINWPVIEKIAPDLLIQIHPLFDLSKNLVQIDWDNLLYYLVIEDRYKLFIF